jgi:hypothetical protein
VSGLAHLNDPQGSQERDLLANAADAKARICVYGSGPVIEAFAALERLGAIVGFPQQRRSFVAMIAAIRKDSGNASSAKVRDIGLLLLGSDE